MHALGRTLRGWYGSVYAAAVGRQAFPKESRSPGWLGGDRYTQGHGSSSVDPPPHPFHPWPGGVARPKECIPRWADRPRADGLHGTQEPGEEQLKSEWAQRASPRTPEFIRRPASQVMCCSTGPTPTTQGLRTAHTCGLCTTCSPPMPLLSPAGVLLPGHEDLAPPILKVSDHEAMPLSAFVAS